MTESKQPSIFRQLTPFRILIIILAGLSFVGYLMFKDFDKESFIHFEWTWNTTLYLLGAIAMVLLRQASYVYRLIILTGKTMSWKRSNVFIFLWEFASAATPSIIGGSAFAIFGLIQEKISAGRTTAIVLFSGFLDEMFFMLIAPMAFILAGVDVLFPGGGSPSESPYFYFFMLGFAILIAYTLFLTYGLFINPEGLKRLLIRISQLRWLQKWRHAAQKTGNDIVITSRELKSQTVLFWAQTFGATVVTWISRFLLVNFLLAAVTSLSFHDQLIIFSRQIVVWVLMLVTPTPGGSGVAEYAFSEFLVEFVPSGYSAPLALLWRLLSYYPYLILGIIVLPRWLKRVYSNKSK